MNLNFAPSGGLATGQLLQSTTSNTDFVRGAVFSAYSSPNLTITISNKTISKTTSPGTLQGYIPSAGTSVIVSTTGAVATDFLEGTNMPSFKNSISSISGYTLTMGSTLSATPTSTFYGYIVPYFTQYIIVADATASITQNSFISGTGVVPPTIMSGYIAPVNYVLTATGGTPTAVTGTTLVGCILTSSTFFYNSYGTIPAVGEFLGHAPGARITAVNTSKQIITTNATLTPVVAFTKLGYILTTSTLQFQDLTSIAVLQGITGIGVGDTLPYVSGINTTTKVVASGTCYTVNNGSSVNRLIILGGDGTYKMLKQNSSVLTSQMITGAGISAQTYTTTPYNSNINNYQAYNLSYVTAPTANTPRFTYSAMYIKGNTVYMKPITGQTINANDFLVSDTLDESIMKLGSYTTNGSTIITGGLLQSVPFYGTTNTDDYIIGKGAVLLEGSTYYYYYTVNNSGSVYYTEIPSLTANSFFTGTWGSGGFDRVDLPPNYPTSTYSITPTAVGVSLLGFCSYDGKMYYEYSTTNYNNIVANGTPALIIIADTTNASKRSIVKTPTVNSSRLTITNVAGTNITFSQTASNTGYAYVPDIGDSNTIYLNQYGSGVPAVGDFIDFDTSLYGAIWVNNIRPRIQAVSLYSTGVHNTYKITIVGGFTGIGFPDSSQVATTGNLSVWCIPAKTISIYQVTSVNLYRPKAIRVYATRSITTTEQTLFSFYASSSNFKYTGSTYTQFVPQTYNKFQHQTYNFSSPVSMSYYSPQLYSFYTTGQQTIFSGSRIINIPQITDPTDTLVTNNFTATLTNKTLTAPSINNGTITSATITTPTINTPTINTATINTGTINTSLSLFGSNFRYVPWTTYASNALNNFSTLVKSTNTLPQPAPATSATWKGNYCVIGDTMFMNMSYNHTAIAGAVAGSGQYIYPIPGGYVPDITNNVAVSSTTNGTGTVVGTCSFVLIGTNDAIGSVYIVTQGTFPNWTYHLILNGQAGIGTVSYNVQSNTYYQFTAIGGTGGAYYSFQASFPIV